MAFSFLLAFTRWTQKYNPNCQNLIFLIPPLLQYIWHHEKLPNPPNPPNPPNRGRWPGRTGSSVRGTLWDGPVASQPDAESRKPMAGRRNGQNWRHSLDTIPGPPPGSESLGPTTKPKESPPRKLKKKKDTSSSKPPFYGVLRFCVVRIFCFSSPQLPKKWASTKLPHPIQESPNMS